MMDDDIDPLIGTFLFMVIVQVDYFLTPAKNFAHFFNDFGAV